MPEDEAVQNGSSGSAAGDGGDQVGNVFVDNSSRRKLL